MADKYLVQVDFKDKEDGGKLYEAGERYPRPANKKIPKERLEFLATTKSKRKGIPFIAKESEPKEVEEETSAEGNEDSEQ